VRAILATKAPTCAGLTRCQTPALLRRLIFARTAAPRRRSTPGAEPLYCDYVSVNVIKRGPKACPMPRVPAGEIEAAVVEQARALIRTPEVVVRTWRAAREEDAEISENDILEALQCLDPVWDELCPTEQARILQLLSHAGQCSCLAGRKYLPRQDDLASVVHWYHSLPTAPFPMLQDGDYLEVI
jgi:site-specific DNA recombinase